MRFQSVFGGIALSVLSVMGLASCGAGKKTADQAYCDQVKAIGDFTTALDDVDPTDTKGSAKKLAEISAKINKITDVSPPEVKTEWTRVGQTFRRLGEAMDAAQGVDFSDPSKIDPKLLATLAELRTSTKDMDQLGETIDIFTKGKCGFAIGK
jgi:hypothetical protein